MRRWELSIALDPARELPIFLQLAGAIADDIRQGRLRPGDVLPGSRELAARLGVNRNTVVAGYDELAAEGLVRTRAGGGTFVAEPPPQPPAAPVVERDTPTYALPPLVLPPVAPAPAAGLLMLHGAPDTRLFPAPSNCAGAHCWRRRIRPAICACAPSWQPCLRARAPCPSHPTTC